MLHCLKHLVLLHMYEYIYFGNHLHKNFVKTSLMMQFQNPSYTIFHHRFSFSEISEMTPHFLPSCYIHWCHYHTLEKENTLIGPINVETAEACLNIFHLCILSTPFWQHYASMKEPAHLSLYI